MEKFINKVICGDCKDVMREMPDNSVHSIVTDPPYGIGFMGKEWDTYDPTVNKGSFKIGTGTHPQGYVAIDKPAFQAFTYQWAKECLRVLKPGGHILSACGTRTYHRMACAIEDAGFEIRDCIGWIYGCLSEDTEILTINGWEHYHKALDKNPVLCYNVESGRYEFQKPTRSFCYENEYTAYRIQSDKTDQIVSRNHRVVIERGGKLIFQRAEELQSEENIPFLESLSDLPETISCLNEGTGIEKQRLLELCAEKEREREQRKIQDTGFNLQELWKGISSKVGNDRQGGLLFSEMQREGKSKKPCEVFRQWKREEEPPEISLGSKQSRLEGRSNLFQKARKLLADKIHQVSAGVFSYGSERRLCYGTSANNGSISGQIAFENRGNSSYQSQPAGQQDREPAIIFHQSSPQTLRRTRAKVTPIEYHGKVWCVEVPSGAFVARRNGKIFITGNSGFPKSLDIGKAVDKSQGNEREAIGRNPNSRENCDKSNTLYESGTVGKTDISTKGNSEWEGYGTALKPAMELWTLARKPLSEKTVAANVLKWGTGGLNIDGCRVGSEGGVKKVNIKPKSGGFQGNGFGCDGCLIDINKGRFPANLIHDGSDEVVREFPDTVPTSYATKNTKKGGMLSYPGHGTEKILDNNNSAARFFYCAKASKSERNKGLDKIEIILYNIYKENKEEDILCKEKSLTKEVKLVRLLVDMEASHLKVIAESGTKNKSVSEWSIGLFGESLMEKYQKDFQSIILTETQSITTSQIYKWLVFLLINEYTEDVSLEMANGGSLAENAEKSKELILTISEKMASHLGVESVVLPTQLKISVKEETCGHPTVKPISLTRYLCRLITPPQGIVLDPFAGSGSTGIAAKLEGFNYILIEKEQEYVDIDIARIKAWVKEEPAEEQENLFGIS